MSAYLDPVERAVVIAAAVVFAVIDIAGDVLVGKFGSHNNTSFRFEISFRCVIIMDRISRDILWENFPKNHQIVISIKLPS